MTTAVEEAQQFTVRRQGKLIEIASDVACYQQPIVNLYFCGEPGAPSGSWVLVDTGLQYTAGLIKRQAEMRYGEGSRPMAIILTHGHFDHVGGVCELANEWNVPVFAHRLELPYISGRSSYPPGDPSVGGGGMAWMARLYPRGPINLGIRVNELPSDSTVPGMPGWRWIHTPGHSPGHVSLFREADRCLIAGDAFVTTKQESLIAALFQPMHVHAPPAYYTIDWQLARRSIEVLAELNPHVAGTGHGKPMAGGQLIDELHDLSRNFDEQAIPAYGRYVREPAIADEDGVVFTPPPVVNPRQATVAVSIAVVGAALMGYWYSRRTTRLRREFLTY